MRRTAPLKLLSEVRDLQLVDTQGRICGMVDEIELSGGPGKSLRVEALLVGPGAWRGRLPAWGFLLVRLVAGDRVVRVPWSAVDHVTSRVFLNRTAETLGLMRAENRLAAIFARLRL
jgi:sporulation protein YlmC with PRC-barrel domain